MATSSKIRTYQYPFNGYSDNGILKVRYSVTFDLTPYEYEDRWEYDIESIKFIDSDGKTSTELYGFMQNCDLMEKSLDDIKDKIDRQCEDEWLERKEMAIEGHYLED